MSDWTDEILDSVWAKGKTVIDYDPALVRKDYRGRRMLRNEHGDTDSIYGWEVDHIIRVSDGGSDHISNLRPTNWQTNRKRG